MQRLFIANWKMNPPTVALAQKLFSAIADETAGAKNARVVVAVPFPFLAMLPKSRRIARAAQNLFGERTGAYTGEVSAPMIKATGAEFVLVGHSERRAEFGETDSAINRKLKAALATGLAPVLCVGERDRADESFQQYVRKQLLDDCAGIPKNRAGRLIIAYEPVWAIGTGTAVLPNDLFEMVTYIRRILLELFGKGVALRIPILYGGSVTAENARQFLNVAGIGGLLVGGASLDAREFGAIVKSGQ